MCYLSFDLRTDVVRLRCLRNQQRPENNDNYGDYDDDDNYSDDGDNYNDSDDDRDSYNDNYEDNRNDMDADDMMMTLITMMMIALRSLQSGAFWLVWPHG